MDDTNRQEQISQLRAVQDIYVQEYEKMMAAISGHLASMDALGRGIEMLSKIDLIRGNTFLMPADSGLLLKVKDVGETNIIMYVGAGYLVEKSIDDAKVFIEKSIKKNTDSLAMLSGQKEKLEQELFKIDYRINSLMQ